MKLPKVAVVLPAYNARKTLEATYQNLPEKYKNDVFLCDDASTDDTVSLSRGLGIKTLVHSDNRGYGANQKTLYKEVIGRNYDYVVMVHPDNQYETKCLPEMEFKLKKGAAMVLASRMNTARKNSMPLWRFTSNRGLTILQNWVYKTTATEYHSGMRAYRAEALRRMPLSSFSDDFVFDSEVIAWLVANDYQVAEVETQCFYGGDASSIGILSSLKYGLATLVVLYKFKRGRYVSR